MMHMTNMNDYEILTSQMFGGHKNYVESLQEIIKFAKLQPNQNVLEICCGTGLVTKEVERYTNDITAVELNPKRLEFAKKNIQKARLIQQDAHTLEPTIGTFDLILCVNGYHYLDPDKFYTMAQRMLKPEGRIVFNAKIKTRETIHEQATALFNEMMRELGYYGNIFSDGKDRGYIEPIPKEKISIPEEFYITRQQQYDLLLSKQQPEFSFQISGKQIYAQYWKNRFYYMTNLEPLRDIQDSQWGGYRQQQDQPIQYEVEYNFLQKLNDISSNLLKTDLFLELKQK